MSEDAINRLTSLFERFPGIGPRQAQRFVQYLLRSAPGLRRDLADAVQSLSGSVKQCSQCFRYYSGSQKICGICTNPERDEALLAIVATDADLAALERSATYQGHYFVLGGTIHLASDKMSNLRVKQLLDRVAKDKHIKEIILAFPANPEGDATSIRVREACREIVTPDITITSLGRGLSTGSELEYADSETIKSAFESRK